MSLVRKAIVNHGLLVREMCRENIYFQLTMPASELANLDISSLIGSVNPSCLSISAAWMQNKLRNLGGEGTEREVVFWGRSFSKTCSLPLFSAVSLYNAHILPTEAWTAALIAWFMAYGQRFILYLPKCLFSSYYNLYAHCLGQLATGGLYGN